MRRMIKELFRGNIIFKKTTLLFLLLLICVLLVGAKLLQLAVSITPDKGAINEYYADTTGGSDENPSVKPPSYTETKEESESNSARQHSENSPETTPSNFKLLSWNLDGLDIEHIEERTEAVVKTIILKQPDIVILQEVVPYSLKIFHETCEGYMVLVGEYSVPYFNAILVRNSSVKTKATSLQFVQFPDSIMGRHYLIQPIKFADAKIIVMTSHLESMANNGVERKKQFKEVLDYMKRQNEGFNIIFGGDTNLRDKEVTAIGGIPQGIQDIWEQCGSKQSTKFTWDSVENDNIKGGFTSRLRFDRIFLRSATGAKKLAAKTFSLLGKERLQRSGKFPSDHWAVWIEFTVQD